MKETGWDSVIVYQARGIAKVDYKNLAGLNIGKVYNPNFVRNADWYMKNCIKKPNGVVIPYKYKWWVDVDGERIVIPAPFLGCEAQTNALMECIYKYRSTEDRKYLDFCHKLLDGYRYMSKDGWFECLTLPDGRGTGVLNSHITTLLVLFEYLKIDSSFIAMQLFDKGVKALELTLEDYLLSPTQIYYDRLYSEVKEYSQHPEYLNQILEIAYLSKSEKIFEIYQHHKSENFYR